MTAKPPMQLSKSDYLLYLKHPAWLWLKKHQPKALPAVDDNLQAVFDQGNLFESIAEQKFVGLSRLGFDGYQEYLSLPTRTRELLEAGDKLIAQARFEHGQLTCICDVIEQVGERELDLYEIKASTSVKSEHIDDLAFQTVVLEGAGYKVRSVAVCYANNLYTRSGEVEVDKLVVQEDVTDRVRAKLESTKREAAKAVAVMKQAERPDISPTLASGAGLKEWLKIYQSLEPTEEKYSIYNLCRLTPQLLRQLKQEAVDKIDEIPDSTDLKPAQKLQVAVTRSETPIVDQDKIKLFLDNLTYPLYFFDYETLSSVVPPFDGLKPYQQLPFQYSLHVLDKPGGELKHLEYLHEMDDNPGPALLEQMKRDIGPSGNVLVWYESFEKGCNKDMARLWPEYKDFLLDVNDRVVDLMKPFSLGWYADKDFFGSASIKNVLPVLVPEKNHKDLEVSDGASAQRLWMQTVLGGADENKAKVMLDLRDYCELDTLAMVKIYEYLLDVVKPGKLEPVQASLF